MQHRNSVHICSCGAPRLRGDKIVIEGEVIYCNFACRNIHSTPAHEYAPKPTGRVRFELEPEA